MFQEVVVSKRQYMKGVTAIDPACLLQLSNGNALAVGMIDVVSMLGFTLC